MSLPGLLESERLEIAELTRALFDADVAGVATIDERGRVDLTLRVERRGHEVTVAPDWPETLPAETSPFGHALRSDPDVARLGANAVRPLDGPFTAFLGLAVPDPHGGIDSVLWAASIEPQRVLPSRDDLLHVLGRQLRRRLDTAEEQRQLRTASLSVSESAGMLATSLLRAEASNRDLEAFAYVASHELHRPLTAISAVAEVLGDSIEADEPVDPERYSWALAQIEQNARQLQQQIAALLAMSRLDADIGEPAELDLTEVVNEVLLQITPLLDSTETTVEVAPLPPAFGEPSALASVIRNLVSNAVVYRHPDRAPIIRITAESEGDAVRIDVIDNGIGIDLDDADRLFEMFQRGPSEQPGTGIGLALCRRLVERMGGEIGVDQAPDPGSRFWFTLPRHLPSRQAPDPGC